MNTAIAITPEQYIFASDNTLKTTSLKIAERFEKDHSNVLKAIDKILTQVSESFREVNFNVSEYEQENSLGKIIKYRFYEMTRDGFMIVVMSFTGKPAMEIKEWYINAFNLMHDKLFPKHPYGLKQPPPSPYISEAEALQLKKSIANHCQKTGVSNYGELYEKIYTYFGITSYLRLPAGKLAEAARLIGVKLVAVKKPVLPPEPFKLSFTPEELEDLVAERVKALEGEWLPQEPGITLADVEKLIEQKLKTHQPALSSPQEDNPLSYRLRANRPGDIRQISDCSVDDFNVQLIPQGYKIVRI